MWYENTEEKNAPKPHPEKRGEEQQGSHKPGAAAGENPAFPRNADPTKAFEDDTENDEGTASGDEVASLKRTIHELDEKANVNYDRYLRALAELDNYKKRAARDRAELLRSAGEDLLMEILPVVDNLERTLVHLTENTDIQKLGDGVKLIYKQFVQALEKSGVGRIDQAPSAFNPSIHQALQKVEDKSVADDTVVEILQKGYTLNGKVVRPAMVKVAKH